MLNGSYEGPHYDKIGPTINLSAACYCICFNTVQMASATTVFP